MNDGFYRAFEERYYAPRDFIKLLRKQYLPFVEPLVKHYPASATFDIGCGRGEWLELMQEIGFLPYGVDLDQGMLSSCIELDLPAEKGDAVAFLENIADESQAIVTAFHVVEHITFEQLQKVVSEALRVLKPGGLLIMETPNPENIVVATSNFYLDPTHHRPIPCQLLSFLPEYYGFRRTKTIRLQESDYLMSSASLNIIDVLGGVSPDYAVIAQKKGSDDIFSDLDNAFNCDYGVSLNTISKRYDDLFDGKILAANIKSSHAEERAVKAEEKAAQAEALALKVEAAVNYYATHLEAIYSSSSWRITSPFRRFMNFIKSIRS